MKPRLLLEVVLFVLVLVIGLGLIVDRALQPTPMHTVVWVIGQNLHNVATGLVPGTALPILEIWNCLPDESGCPPAHPGEVVLVTFIG